MYTYMDTEKYIVFVAVKSTLVVATDVQRMQKVDVYDILEEIMLPS